MVSGQRVCVVVLEAKSFGVQGVVGLLLHVPTTGLPLLVRREPVHIIGAVHTVLVDRVLVWHICGHSDRSEIE